MSFQLRQSGRWQKLWLRYSTDQDVKKEDTKGSESRFYQLQKKKKEVWLKKNGLFNPNYHKRGEDAIGNSNFLKKAIRKQERPVGVFNKRNRREDSASSSEEEEAAEDAEKIKETETV